LVSRCHRSEKIALPAVAEICEDWDIILVLDDIPSGTARTGTWFAATVDDGGLADDGEGFCHRSGRVPESEGMP
jgi:hypothetical protein